LRGVVVSNEDGNEGWVLPAAAWTAAVEELTREGTRLRGWLGVSLGTVRLSPAQAESAGRETALLIREAVPEGPGSLGGLQPGDLILSSDGVEIPGGELPSLWADTPVVLDILRGAERLSLRIVPAVRR
jgi:serine protease Do